MSTYTVSELSQLLVAHSAPYMSANVISLVNLATIQRLRSQVRHTGIKILQVFTLEVVAFILYDHLITFGQEVRAVWQRKFSAVSLLIVSTRWALVIHAIIVLLPNELFVSGHPI